MARRPEEASRENNPAAAGIERFFSLKGPREEKERQSLIHYHRLKQKKTFLFRFARAPIAASACSSVVLRWAPSRPSSRAR